MNKENMNKENLKKLIIIGLCISLLALAGCTKNNCTGAAIHVSGCADDGKIFYQIENNGQDINDLKIAVQADYNTTALIKTRIRQGNTWTGNLNVGLENIKSIDVLPRIDYKTCYNQAKHIKIKNC